MANSWEKEGIYPNLVLPRRWLVPKAHWGLGSFALNSIASAWLGANACLPLPSWPWPVLTPSSHPHWESVALINVLPESQRSLRPPSGARSAPHHCRQYVTFSAMGRGWEREKVKMERKTKEKKEEEEDKKTFFSSLDLKHNRHF